MGSYKTYDELFVEFRATLARFKAHEELIEVMVAYQGNALDQKAIAQAELQLNVSVGPALLRAIRAGRVAGFWSFASLEREVCKRCGLPLPKL